MVGVEEGSELESDDSY